MVRKLYYVKATASNEKVALNFTYFVVFHFFGSMNTLLFIEAELNIASNFMKHIRVDRRRREICLQE